MIIPVRCFTCGKVGLPKTLILRLPLQYSASHCYQEYSTSHCSLLQVIGNMWDLYLDLLQAGYTEG